MSSKKKRKEQVNKAKKFNYAKAKAKSGSCTNRAQMIKLVTFENIEQANNEKD